MTEFLAGAAGAVGVLVVFFSGWIIGWRCHRTAGGDSIRAAPLSEAERRRIAEAEREGRARQDAFDKLMHFSADDVYGTRDDVYGTRRQEGG